MNNIFLSENWLNIVSNNNKRIKPVLIVLNDNNIFIGEIKIIHIKIWILYQEVYDLIGIIDKAKKENVSAIECNFNMSRFLNKEELEKHGSKIEMEFGTYVVNLNQSEDEIWSKIHSKHRNVIRKAEKENVKVKTDVKPEDIYEIIKEVYAKDNRSGWSLEYINSIKENLKNNVLFIGAFLDEKLQAAAIVPFDSSTGYYLHGGIKSDAVLGSSNMLQWEIIKILKLKGIKKYDFGGARKKAPNKRLEGIFRFKERFGGEFVPCYFWSLKLNSLNYLIYKILKRIRKIIR
ncbi:MAG: peptidoglycan bridge formation glycyltransferase FemA/FemB family protein [Spirochaetia bacterium]|nr:peptidoglycan bridge formation glycyltransferase FemA/FemB family protein [Spirochaetia bacterium]